MRKLLLFLLPLIGLYAIWFYWQQRADRPLQENLLTVSAEAITKIIVAGQEREQPLTLTRTETGWVVAKAPRQVLDQAVRAEALAQRLTALQTDSVSNRTDLPDGFRIALYDANGLTDELLLHQPPEGTPLAQVVATGDVFHLPPATVRYIFPALSFNHYREQRLLHLLPGQVDSIVAARNDSTLWVVDSAAAVSRLSDQLLDAQGAAYADYFDEIAHRDRYHADLNFYFSGRAHRVRVYQDSLWPQPFVLVGDDFPRRFLGFERLR